MPKLIMNENPFIFETNEKNLLNESSFLENNRPNNFAIYLAVSQAKKWFADYIIKLDKETKYHVKSEKEVKDPIAVKKALNAYNKQRKEAIRLINEWKKNNIDLFEIQYSIPQVARYVRKYHFPIDLVPSVEDAIEGYKYSNKYLKDTDWAPIATQERRVILPEYKEEFRSVIDKIYAEVGFPGDTAIKNEVTETIMEPRTRLCLNRKPAESIDSAAIFADHFYRYLLTTDFTPETEEEENEEE